MKLFSVLAANQAGGNAGAGSSVMLFAMIGLMVVFYVVMFRKQSKEQKQHDLVVSSVEAGDSILTSSGFYGVVTDVSDDIIIVEFGNNKNCRIPMKKECVLEVEKAEK